ncbi:hypothetical protein [Variovorax sp. J31P207]|uniref:hypothetical protein n=1 Tax=Variovorax sp. J31P207 TaxID=3053510 RepID=UPI00257548FD|nr:hypothetical protein [Variovorax sp. J31P207]MDM0071550.1 hypothetical protein [Variovorax sp. J31P207]
MQFMCLLRAPEGEGEGLATWYREVYAQQLLAQAPGLERFIVNVPTPVPAELQLYGGAESARSRPYDVIAQMWFDSRGPFDAATASLEGELCRRSIDRHVYRMSETVALNKPELLPGNPAPGFKLMRGLFFHEDMPDAAVQRSWALHQNLAVKVHVGLARYVRHWVDEVITPEAPRIRGMSDLHFPDERSLVERYFDSDRGKEEILHDIGHFIEGGTARMFAKEFLVK